MTGRARGRRRGAVVAAALVMVAGLAITSVVALQVRSRAERAADEAFQDQATSALTITKQEINRFTTSLRDVGAFATNARTLDPAAGADYVASTNFYEQAPTVTSLIFLKRVSDADLEGVLADMRTSTPGVQRLDLGAQPPGSDHWIVTAYIPGSRDFHVPVGLDLSSLPGIGEQLLRTAATGRSVALSLESSPQLRAATQVDVPDVDRTILGSDFFVAVPSYRGAKGDTSRPPDGLVVAVVSGFATRIASTADMQFGDLGFKLAVNLSDYALTDINGYSQVAQLDGEAGPSDQATASTRTVFSVDGIDWSLEVWRGPAGTSSTTALWGVIGVGVLVSLLLALVAYLLHNEITSRRREHETLAERARRDPMTGLANRDEYASAFADATHAGDRVAVLYIDLDDFKQINDTFGHGAGDQVLIETAERIHRAVRDGDLVARIGGDEFAVLLPSADQVEADHIAQRILAEVAAPIALDDAELVTTASVGIAVVDTRDGESVHRALERADQAMYDVKRRARHRGRS